MASTNDLVTNSTTDIPKVESGQNAQKTYKNMSLKEKIYYVKSLVTVELVLASYAMTSVLCIPALTALELEKSCRVNNNYNDTVCDAILHGQNQLYPGENHEVQVTVATMHSWQQSVNSIMPLILVLFLGSYSDRHKIRKPFIIMPLLGELLAVTGCILCVIFMDSWSLEIQGIAQTVIPSFFGSPTIFIMAIFAYIADVSTREERTLRIGIAQITLSIFAPLFQSFSGILFKHIGYIPILLIGGALYSFALFYTIFFIKEPNKTEIKMDKSLLLDVFNPKHVVETFNILVKKSPGNNRLQIVFVLFFSIILNIVVTGEESVLFLYVQNIFQWTVVELSYWKTFSFVTHLIGNAVGIALLAKIFKLHDLLIIILAFLDKSINNIIYAAATSSTWLYVGSIVGLFTGLSPIVIRSMATKTVSENDIGKAQSLLGVSESIGQAFGAFFYSSIIYVNTLKNFPSAYFYFGILLFGIAIIAAGVIYLKERVKQSKQNPEKGITENITINNLST